MKLKFHTVVQNQGFCTLRKYKKTDRKKDARSRLKSLKIGASGAPGFTFYEFGRFVQALNSCVFGSAKSATNLENSDCVCAQMQTDGIWGSARRNARCHQ